MEQEPELEPVAMCRHRPAPRLAGLGLVLPILACSSPAPRPALAPADDDVVEIIRQDWGAGDSWLPWMSGTNDEFAVGFGGAYWADLPGLDPDISFPTSGGFGNLQTWGFSFDLSYHHRIAGNETDGLWLGLRFGVQSWEQRKSFNVVLPDGERIDDAVNADVIHLLASLRADHDFGPFRGFAGGGGGLYEFSVHEEEDYWGGTDELTEDSALGGFLSLGIDFPITDGIALRLEDQVHWVRFDGLDEFTPGEDSISGPFNTLQLGMVGRF